jgi:hypothetical protein
MKKFLSRTLLSPGFQMSVLGGLARSFVRATDGLYSYSPRFKLGLQVSDRPHYAWCVMKAAELARALGHERVSAIEFGVAGGNGLAFMCDYVKDVKLATGVEVECYGFDTGTGMPSPEGARDLPYWFQEAQYKMDVDALKRRVPRAKLVLGDIRNNIGTFLEEHDPPPIGAIFNDTDYWSSTRESFRLYDQVSVRPHNFLPRQFMYFDDIIGREYEMYGPYNGQLLAIEEYNAVQDKVRIHRNQNLIKQIHIQYRWQIYYAHLFEHPDYGTYIGHKAQKQLEEALQLR